MANVVCDFDMSMKEEMRLVAHSNNSILLPSPIIEFETYMDNARETNEIKNNEIPAPKRVKLDHKEVVKVSRIILI